MIDESGLQQARVLGLKMDSSKFVPLQAGGKGDGGKGWEGRVETGLGHGTENTYVYETIRENVGK